MALRVMEESLAVGERVAAIDWGHVLQELDAQGSAVLDRMLTRGECTALAALYRDDSVFRSRVVMGSHGFGRGEYKYFRYPLPEIVAELRTELYPRLAPIANGWNAAMNIAIRYPEMHDGFLRRCHSAGQKKPTPLLLEYGEGDFNCLHQDLYGEHVFPIQVAILLSEPGKDFTGGEFVLTEQRPRMQSRAEVVGLRQGDGVAFAVHHRPVKGPRGTYRVRTSKPLNRRGRGVLAESKKASFARLGRRGRLPLRKRGLWYAERECAARGVCSRRRTRRRGRRSRRGRLCCADLRCRWRRRYWARCGR